MFVSMVAWVVLVTKLETEGMVRFRKSVADFSIDLGDDDWMNRRRSPSFFLYQQCFSVYRERLHVQNCFFVFDEVFCFHLGCHRPHHLGLTKIYAS